MKILIKRNVHCDYDNLKKYLPAQYVPLVPKCYYGDAVNFVVFSVKNAATSNEVLKAQKKVGDSEIKTFYFAYSFTSEAEKIISESNGIAFYWNNYTWNDNSCNNYRNSISCGIHGGKL